MTAKAYKGMFLFIHLHQKYVKQIIRINNLNNAKYERDN